MFCTDIVLRLHTEQNSGLEGAAAAAWGCAGESPVAVSACRRGLHAYIQQRWSKTGAQPVVQLEHWWVLLNDIQSSMGLLKGRTMISCILSRACRYAPPPMAHLVALAA